MDPWQVFSHELTIDPFMVPGGSLRKGRDPWGERSNDPFIRELRRNPKRYALLQAAISVGLALFWVLFIIGLLVYFAFLLL
ncbi:MAG: hypothetical protein QCI82_08285 [Candidatus Thermoplasmatota archaeon]|nr:hypothetical protein [Candidatus Thermoplasmatota archaeon]